jgi:diguanylate cyclase (GGDEF)-like protein
MICDIDHFKRINDAHGHLVGDEVLQKLSRRIRELVRPYDGVGRYGGEEFLVVLGNCGATSLKKRAEELREGICRTPFSTTVGEISLSISIGAITAEECNKPVDGEVLLREADFALYRAKDAGRNLVVYA